VFLRAYSLAASPLWDEVFVFLPQQPVLFLRWNRIFDSHPRPIGASL
jgi:hypothetical protein